MISSRILYNWVALKTAEDKAVAARAPEAPSQFPYNSIYFYHPDHLGTTNYLTDANGQPYQLFMNMPFGESLIEQHSLTEDYEHHLNLTVRNWIARLDCIIMVHGTTTAYQHLAECRPIGRKIPKC
jgi:hypothetical protein